MKLNFTIVAIFLVGGIFSIQAQIPTAAQIIDKSISYHDPDDRWSTTELTFHLLELRPKGKDRYSSIIINNKRGKTTINRLEHVWSAFVLKISSLRFWLRENIAVYRGKWLYFLDARFLKCWFSKK